ncbi:MAG: hypothetical protein LBU32_02340 [Clostridiales bacterium]|nr:hypothetical protein [Clostridiales bacterium]
MLVKSNKQLALLDGLSARIPNVSLSISMYVHKEALMSSQIDGTQATLEDVLDQLIDENANCNVWARCSFLIMLCLMALCFNHASDIYIIFSEEE